MILVSGENLIDFVQGADQDGKPAYVANPGGSPLNCARALARQDVDVAYISPISTDALGGLIAQYLDDDGVPSLGGRVDAPTSLAVVSLENGIPSYAFHREGTAERHVTLDALRRHLSPHVLAFHVSSLALIDGPDADAFEAFFLECRDQRILTSLDPNIRAMLVTDRGSYMARLERMMAACDILKLSDEDADWMYPGQGLEQVKHITGAALTVVTRGPDGATGWTKTQDVAIPAAPVSPLVDTVGAGDTFSGTLLAELTRQDRLSRPAIEALSGGEVEALLGLASRAAAINCTRAGCQPPHLSELFA